MFGLISCGFDYFLFLDLSLRCHEALIILFSLPHELNLVAATLTHIKISKEDYATKTLFLTCFCISSLVQFWLFNLRYRPWL